MPKKHYRDGLIVGADDGVAPVYEPDSVWKTWAKHEIFAYKSQGEPEYISKKGEGKYVPKVDDLIRDLITGTVEKVVSIDTTTLVAELVPYLLADVETLDKGDILTAIGRRCRHDTYRVYLDTSVIPHTLCVDHRFSVYGTMASYVKIFKGSDLTDDTQVISMIYDHTGKLVSNNISLELALYHKSSNHAVYTVPPCHTMEKLPDGEFVNVVAYTDVGQVLAVREMIIENTSIIKQPDKETKYITDITLDTPYLSPHSPETIEYPLNVPVSSLNMFGVVHYSDGSTRRLPVDNTKFSALGLRDYVATVPNYQFEFTLKYNLSKDEIAIRNTNLTQNKNSTYNRFITKVYRGHTTTNDSAYMVRLYAYPRWINEVSGYGVDFWLVNMERSFCLNVTEYVNFNSNTRQYRGTLYGGNQRVSVSIDLSEAKITSKPYTHTQVIDIILRRKATDRLSSPWAVGNEITQFPYFGEDNWVYMTNINHNLKTLDVSLGEKTLDAWLQRAYYTTRPLYDQDKEVEAPKPNIFKVVTPYRIYEFPIHKWNQPLEINDLLNDLNTLYIQFIKRTNDTDLYLGVGGYAILPR